MPKDIRGEGLAWQVATWNQMADLYASENAPRMAPVAERVIFHAELKEGEAVLDLGTGTVLVAQLASASVGPSGRIVGIDISPDMLTLARNQTAERGLSNIAFDEGGAVFIPAQDGAFDVVLASLSLMYVVDRAAAAREIARVLRPNGRFIA